MWCIVRRGFYTDTLLVRGELVDASKWRNAAALIESGYISEPANDAERALIKEVSEGASVDAPPEGGDADGSNREEGRDDVIRRDKRPANDKPKRTANNRKRG